MSRERAEELDAAQARAAQPAARPARQTERGPRTPSEPLPGDVKALLVGAALVALAGIGWLPLGPPSDPIVPVLGFVDTGPPPAPRPSPPPEPAFKLPWWK